MSNKLEENYISKSMLLDLIHTGFKHQRAIIDKLEFITSRCDNIKVKRAECQKIKNEDDAFNNYLCTNCYNTFKDAGIVPNICPYCYAIIDKEILLND